MKEMEMACFQIISFAGEAKSCYIEALDVLEVADYEKAKTLIQQGDECFSKCHETHFQLIQKEANEEVLDIRLLLIHAEDQLMSAETIKILAERMINLHQQITNIKRS